MYQVATEGFHKGVTFWLEILDLWTSAKTPQSFFFFFIFVLFIF